MKREEALLLASGVITWALVSYLAYLQMRHQGIALWQLWSHGVFLALFLPVAARPGQSDLRRPAWRLVLVLQAAAALAAIAALPHSLTPILLVIWAAQLPGAWPGAQSYVALALVNLLAFLALPALTGQATDLLTALIYCGFELFALGSAKAKQQLAEANQLLQASNRQLAATRSLLAQSARFQERGRIARDLHDSIGHSLTALSLQLEVAKHQAAPDQQPLLAQLKAQVSDALTQVRAIVQQMRKDTDTDLVPPLQALADKLPGVTLALPPQLPLPSLALAEQVLYCLTEGVSNALRHGKANQLSLARDGAALALTDNGSGPKAAASPGSGLAGMGERLAPFGGSARLDPLPGGGARLTLWLGAQHD